MSTYSKCYKELNENKKKKKKKEKEKKRKEESSSLHLATATKQQQPREARGTILLITSRLAAPAFSRPRPVSIAATKPSIHCLYAPSLPSPTLLPPSPFAPAV